MGLKKPLCNYGGLIKELQPTDYLFASVNYAQKAYALLSTNPAIAETLGGDLTRVTNSLGLTSQQAYFTLAYLPVAKSITGVSWWQATTGSYTASNFNGVAVNSLSLTTGVLTQLAVSANDGSIWQTAANGTKGYKAFTAPTSVQPEGVYVISLLYSSSAQTTQPLLGGYATIAGSVANWDFANSVKLAATWASQTALPTTKAYSGLASTTIQIYASLY